MITKKTDLKNSGSDEFRENRRRQRDLLSQEEIRTLCVIDNWRSMLGVLGTLGVIMGAILLATFFWHPLVVIPAIIVIASRQQALFVLVHDSVHYRLFSVRWLNDLVGRLLAMPGGISMCTYRVIHRLHHNHLFEERDPDVPLIAGYPRGRRYLLVKLAKDLIGLNAWKTFKYFFGAPVINDDAVVANRPLDDTAPRLRQAARRDRWWVVVWHVVLFLAAVIGGWWVEYLVLWLLPLVTVMQVLLRLRAVLEHGAVTDQLSVLRSARTNLGSRWLMWFLFPHCVNYHIEHHLFPAIPFYNLPKCHELLSQKGVMLDAEVRSTSESLEMIMADRVAIN